MKRPSKAIICLSVIAVGCATLAIASAASATWLVAASILFLASGTVAGCFWLLDRKELSQKLAIYGEGEAFLAEAAAERERAYAETAEILAQNENAAAEIRNAAATAANEWRDHAKADVKAAEQRIAELAKEYATYTEAIAASKRKIEGYATDRVTPATSLLDSLPESLSLSDAGQRLKQARAFSRKLVKADQAATCTDTDAARGKVVARFITDAFNGKVDSILSRVRHEPYATLRQQTLDACNEVNIGAVPFKARITEAYLDARLDELKCAALTFELKVRERDAVEVG